MSLCVGVDGGATRVRACVVHVSWEGKLPRVSRAGPIHAQLYPRAEGFEPWPLERQLEQPERPASEVRQAGLCLDALARCILDAVAASPGVSASATEVRVAVCLPGLRRADNRGIRAALHLPRMPDCLSQLEQRLRQAGLSVAPLEPILSDGRARGLGERFAVGGALASTSQGYYLGAGTGLPEAFVIDGAVMREAELPASLARAWELTGAAGASFETRISAAAVNRAWRLIAASSARGPRQYPELCADAGDGRARKLLSAAGRASAELVRARQKAWPRFAGGPLERVVLGQRLASWWARASFRDSFEAELARSSIAMHDAVRPSELPEGAVLGAVAAMRHPVRME